MGFGPEIALRRTTPDEAKVNALRFGPYDASDIGSLMPFSPQDPALKLMGQFGGRLPRMSAEEMVGRTQLDDTIAWGIWTEDRQLAGFTELFSDEHNTGAVDYAIFLAPAWRGRGIGSLAVPGVVRAAFTPGLVHAVLPIVPHHGPWEVRTAIHPRNVASRMLCQQAGFVFYSAFMERPVNSLVRTPYPWLAFALASEEGGGEYSVLDETEYKQSRATYDEAMRHIEFDQL